MQNEIGWLPDTREPAPLTCVYCGLSGDFPHEVSCAWCGFPYHIHKCPQCASLIYDMRDEPEQTMMEGTDESYVINARYNLEIGYNLDFVVQTPLSALGELSEEELGRHIFFDVGAGLGLGSYFVQQVFGAEVLAVEPSPSGRIGAKVFGIDLRPEFFEELSPEVMRHLQSKPSLVHLNAVVEHLIDPRATLENLVARLDMETLAFLVPDAAAVDRSVPMIQLLQTLSPREHRHLPTTEGAVRLLAHLGFAHHAVYSSGDLMIAVGGRRPVSIPSHRTVALARDLMLERLIDHPHPHVSGGAAARLLVRAVRLRQHELLRTLRPRFAKFTPAQLLEWIAKDANWDRIPFYLAPTYFWLAVDAANQGKPHEALALLDVVVAFADRIMAEYPQYAVEPHMFKWESFMYRSELHRSIGSTDAARAALARVVDSEADPIGGARAEQVRRARQILEKF